MADDDAQTQTAPTATTPVPQTFVPQPGVAYFTAEQVEKFRADERSKLQQALDAQKARADEQATQLTALAEAQAEREAAEAKRLETEQAAAKAEADKDRDAKTLLEEKDLEWAQRFDQLRLQQEQQNAAHALERQALELQGYIQSRVAQEIGDKNIAPQLAKFVNGTTKEEVEASIEQVKNTTLQIAQDLAAEQQQTRQQTPGVSTNTGPSSMGSVPEMDDGVDYTKLSMKDYLEKVRPGLGIGQGGQGLFS